MTKETIQKEHRILQLKYAVLAVVVGICVGIVDTIFGRGLLAISDLRTAHWRYLLPFLPLAVKVLPCRSVLHSLTRQDAGCISGKISLSC